MSGFDGNAPGTAKERRGEADNYGRRKQQNIKASTVFDKGTIGHKYVRRLARAPIKSGLRKAGIAERQEIARKRGMSQADMAPCYRRKSRASSRD